MKLTHFLNQAILKKYSILIKKIHSLEESLYKNIKAEDISKKILEIKENNSIKEINKVLHAMALARIASNITLGMSYYDVQLMGALALVDGCIADMKTGEGKTLTCSAAVAANYVLGYKTHVATANEYLAQRDQQILEPLYNLLGISSSFITSKMERSQKKIAYNCDVLYSTAQELGFDFLKDNLVYSIDEKVQFLPFSKIKAIIDEIDFILIDEARTPLIISGDAQLKDVETYKIIKEISMRLKKMEKAPNDNSSVLTTLNRFIDNEENISGDFWIDYKNKTVYLSEEGYKNLEKLVVEYGLINVNYERINSLYSNNSWIIHDVLNALRAEYCYLKDKDYIVHDGKVIIIDKNTGRLSEGRTWSYGLHQAIEAKENVDINPETISLGSISIQNYFRNYAKISGMSGTAIHSSEEFQEIYNIITVQIPTNKKMIRIDHQDRIYLNMNAKYNDIIKDVYKRHAKGQPILIGTTSVKESEIISELLTQKKIKHYVLNAKNNSKEAQIIAQAGQPYAVTVSTNMAGRGTDIILGGNKELLLSILNKQLQSLNERAIFFNNLLNNENDIQNTDNQIINQPEEVNNEIDHIDYNEAQELIDELYNPQHITNFLNKGSSFIKNYLATLERKVQKQIEIVESSWEKWREHVLDVGGLYVLGSSRNESRRIDDQLRGRAGRQGDPGESIFYLSIEDPWVKVFGKNKIFEHLAKNLPSNESISSPILTKAFARAQTSIEYHRFNERRNTFQYDSVADEGRRYFFKLRDSLLESTTAIKSILKMSLLDIMVPMAHPRFLFFIIKELKSDLDDHKELLKIVLALPIKEIKQYVNKFLEEYPDINLKKCFNNNNFKFIEKHIDSVFATLDENSFKVLNSISLKDLDKKWTERLAFIDDAEQNVAFSNLAQKNPLYEFKRICFESFVFMIEEFKTNLIDNFFALIEEIKEQKNITNDLKTTEKTTMATITTLTTIMPTTTID